MVALFVPTFTAFANDDAAAELKKASQSFFTATEKIDKGTLNRLLSPDFLLVTGEGKQTGTTKKDLLESIDKEEQDRQSDPASWSKPLIKSKDVTFRLFADAGVETGVFFSKSQRSQEVQRQLSTSVSITAVRYTNVWVRQQGQWRLVSSHFSVSADELALEDWNK